MTRILFVDDDPRILEALERMLFLVPDWETHFVTSGPAALDELDRAPFDVVVTDMRMPGMDGETLLGHVVERHPSVVRVILSGHTELEAAMLAAPVAHQFLSKPCNPEHLKDSIARACRLRELLADERLRSVVGGIKNLPPRPHVYAALARALNDPNASVSDVARVIERDAGLSAKVLQLVNSAFIGLPHRTSSIESAVRYIGFSLLKSLIAYYEVFEVFVGAGPDSRNPPDERHLVQTAGIARAMVRGSAEAEDAFAAGLLHEIGRMVLEISFPTETLAIDETSRERGVPPHVMEREVLGVTFAETGGYLLGVWGLPFAVVEAVAHQIEPWRLEAGRLDLATVLHVACRLAREQEADGPGASEALGVESMEHLGRLNVQDWLSEWRTTAQEHRLRGVAG